MKHLSLSLTAKIVLLVALMGVASATITVYATWHMQRIESRYHQLMAQQDATTQPRGLGAATPRGGVCLGAYGAHRKP